MDGWETWHPLPVTWGGWQRCVTRAPSRCHSLISEWCVRAGSQRRDSAGLDEGTENMQRTHHLRPQRWHRQSRTCCSADSVTHSCSCSGQWDLQRLTLIFQELVGPMVMHNANIMFVLFVSAFDVIQRFCNNNKCEANLLNFNEHLFNRCRHKKYF